MGGSPESWGAPASCCLGPKPWALRAIQVASSQGGWTTGVPWPSAPSSAPLRGLVPPAEGTDLPGPCQRLPAEGGSPQPGSPGSPSVVAAPWGLRTLWGLGLGACSSLTLPHGVCSAWWRLGALRLGGTLQDGQAWQQKCIQQVPLCEGQVRGRRLRARVPVRARGAVRAAWVRKPLGVLVQGALFITDEQTGWSREAQAMEQAERLRGASSATTRPSIPSTPAPRGGRAQSPRPPTCVVTVSASCLPGRAEREGRGLGTPGVCAR